MLGNLLHRRVELRARYLGELGEYYGSVWGFEGKIAAHGSTPIQQRSTGPATRGGRPRTHGGGL